MKYCPYCGTNVETQSPIKQIYKEDNAMIEIRETANGQDIYVDGYYVGTIHDDGTTE